MKIYYIAKFRYGRPEMCKVWVKKETEKTITPDHTEDILGWTYVGKSIRKNGLSYYTDPKEAIRHIQKAIVTSIDSHANSIIELEKTLEELDLLVNKLDENN